MIHTKLLTADEEARIREEERIREDERQKLRSRRALRGMVVMAVVVGSALFLVMLALLPIVGTLTGQT